MTKAFAALFLATLLVLLGGCASSVPTLIRSAPAEAPEPPQVQADPARYQGQQVRWGGEVIEVANREGVAWIEILARPLWRDGPPRSEGVALGRFLARVQGFVDPAEYAAGTPVTIAGRIIGSEVRSIGDHPYTYPQVEVEARFLWSKQEIDPFRYASPLLYDPWWPYRYHHHHYGRW